MQPLQYYEFQKEIANLILSGKSVILQAPTGSGKTTAALLPFISSLSSDANTKFPHKCVYVVPMRVLANQFIRTHADLAGSCHRKLGRSFEISIQTGENSNDPKFEADLTFCTVDQFLSSYLTFPYSLSTRMANYNAGAFPGRYIIFDEFHLLDPESSLPTTLYAIQQLSQLAPVLLMTATFSATMIDELADFIGAQPYIVSQEEARDIETAYGSQPGRERVWRTSVSHLNSETVLNAHRRRSLVICNTVQRAQLLFREIREESFKRGLGITPLLLHSRFLSEDRAVIEKNLQRYFGKNAKDTGSVIAVTTQTIEVGVDISCEILHTDLAPAASLIQRAGRCARYPGEKGEVIVYPVEKYAPYGKENKDSQHDPAWVREMKNTYQWLRDRDGIFMDFTAEQRLINSVSASRDQSILNDLQAGWRHHSQQIIKVYESGQIDLASRMLVRDADSRRVLIHSNPDEVLVNPYGAQGFNIDLRSLMGMASTWQERGAGMDLEWTIKRLVTDVSDDHFTEYGWFHLHDVSQIAGTPVIVVNPELAGYSAEEGFIPQQGGTSFRSQILPGPMSQAGAPISYRLESYEDHVQCVLEAFATNVLPDIDYPARVLAKKAGWSEDSVVWAAWLVCLLHDTGKLNTDWQEWTRVYQNKIGLPIKAGFAAAHTDFDPENPLHQKARKLSNKIIKKPPHAAEGALAVAKIIAQALKKPSLVKASLTAITRHHAPFARNYRLFRLVPSASFHLKQTLEFIPPELASRVSFERLMSDYSDSLSDFDNLIATPNNRYEWLTYTLLVRALRWSDQEGTRVGSN